MSRATLLELWVMSTTRAPKAAAGQVTTVVPPPVHKAATATGFGLMMTLLNKKYVFWSALSITVSDSPELAPV
jgi:hypothetical protein